MLHYIHQIPLSFWRVEGGVWVRDYDHTYQLAFYTHSCFSSRDPAVWYIAHFLERSGVLNKAQFTWQLNNPKNLTLVGLVMTHILYEYIQLNYEYIIYNALSYTWASAYTGTSLMLRPCAPLGKKQSGVKFPGPSRRAQSGFLVYVILVAAHNVDILILTI